MVSRSPQLPRNILAKQKRRSHNQPSPLLLQAWNNNIAEDDTKRRKMDIKLESEDANFAFPEATNGSPSMRSNAGQQQQQQQQQAANGRITPNGRMASSPRGANVTQSPRPPPISREAISSDGKVVLNIVCQPENQHRARYQTEGSRGAVKDRSGNGFPVVKLEGYNKPTKLQVFIGTDMGKVAPHMFYQACRVSGKNSTPCNELKVGGTAVIEIDMEPEKQMTVTCDCVGILKERNVDVELRFGSELSPGRSKKKSTKCRMIFRTTITTDDGKTETLQACSLPIVCTQPPGIPEICKKSLTSCPCTGGVELFILGKNFLKDTKVIFKLSPEDSTPRDPTWECTVQPDKEFLQQTHLVCVVPPYRRHDLADGEQVTVKMYTQSSGKISEAHSFVYTAAGTPAIPTIGKPDNVGLSALAASDSITSADLVSVVPNSISPNNAPVPFLSSLQTSPLQSQVSPGASNDIHKNDTGSPSSASGAVSTANNNDSGRSCMIWSDENTSAAQQASSDLMMLPPPQSMSAATNAMLGRRASSSMQLILPDNMKTEVLDESSSSSLINENSMSGLSVPVSIAGSPLEHLVNDNARDTAQTAVTAAAVAAAAAGMMGAPSGPVVPTNIQVQVQDPLLSVVGLMRNSHSIGLVQQQTPFANLHESPQVKVLSPHHINRGANALMNNETNLAATMPNPDVVDLRMKHQPEFNGIGNGNLGKFAATPADQPLPPQSGHSIEKYLNQIESASKKADVQDETYVRASIIANNQQIAQASVNPTIDDMVTGSSVKPHQLVNPMGPAAAPSNTLMSNVSGVENIVHDLNSPNTSPNAPNMLLNSLIPTSTVQSMSMEAVSVAAVSNVSMPNPPAEDSLMMGLPAISEASIVTASGAPIVSSSVAEAQMRNDEVVNAMQALAQDSITMEQHVQQVEQVVAQAQQQVEQVVAQAQQHAAAVVEQAQEQVAQQVVQHVHVVQQAVAAVQSAPTAHVQATEQVVQQAVQQAVHQSTQEVVQQVQVVQQAVQHAQAAQVMQQAVQQDISSMLGQPAGFVVEASSALANGAAQEPKQQQLTAHAEAAISDVLTNATQEIIAANRPFTATTAQAVMATTNILNNVATRSAQLMTDAMGDFLARSPTNMEDQSMAPPQPTKMQVALQTSPVQVPIVPMQQSAAVSSSTSTSTPMQQNNEPLQQQEQDQTVRQANAAMDRKPPLQGNNGMEIITDHEILTYINSNCFDPHNNIFM
ncbi:nuclear factor of activated T-cells 5 isoform X6 [Trichogramma pretiosum]|uniref:nuclear factor of activated T-cells 5 isoform X6 n=1 Tax=Trichogramma pretiosum TaxID=7493 RepID=UPI0006C9B115|nr:nuclear factor of activated T-cells 5 isoform X6 [Trichogramma pretiosum]